MTKGNIYPKVPVTYCVHNNKKEVKCVGEKGGLDALFPAEAVGGHKKLRG